MRRTHQLPPVVYGRLFNRLSLALFRRRDFSTLVRLERVFGLKRVARQTRYGFTMALDREDLLQKSVLDGGVWEDECSEAMRNEFRPDDVFFDIGSNVGYHSLLALSADVRQVVAFDPDPLNCAVYELNMALNGWTKKKYQLLQLGLSDQDGVTTFFRSEVGNTGLSGFSPRFVVDQFDVQIRALDNLLGRDELPFPTVMKLDVEGWEPHVLAGCRNLFQSAPPRSVFFECNPGCPTSEREELWAFFENYGYTISRVERREAVSHNNYLAKRLG